MWIRVVSACVGWAHTLGVERSQPTFVIGAHPRQSPACILRVDCIVSAEGSNTLVSCDLLRRYFVPPRHAMARLKREHAA